jgi:hypothetical protein
MTDVWKGRWHVGHHRPIALANPTPEILGQTIYIIRPESRNHVRVTSCGSLPGFKTSHPSKLPHPRVRPIYIQSHDRCRYMSIYNCIVRTLTSIVLQSKVPTITRYKSAPAIVQSSDDHVQYTPDAVVCSEYLDYANATAVTRLMYNAA